MYTKNCSLFIEGLQPKKYDYLFKKILLPIIYVLIQCIQKALFCDKISITQCVHNE